MIVKHHDTRPLRTPALLAQKGGAGKTTCALHLAIIAQVRPAIEIMASGEATVGQLERRLRCSGCGGRRVQITIAADCRPPEVIKRDGPPPESRADPRRRG